MHFRNAPSTAAVYTRVAVLGFVAGLRSQMPLLLLAVAARRGAFARNAGRPLSFLRSRGALLASGALALGELVGDKLPTIPSRLNPGPLVVRLAMGALAGTAITHEAGARVPVGGAIGAVAAGAGSVAGNRFRLFLPRLVRLPHAAAIVEDAVALGLGSLAVSRRRSS